MAAMLHLHPLLISPTSPTSTSSNPIKPKPTNLSSLKPPKTLHHLKQLHCHLTKQALTHKPSSLTTLITSCSEISSPESLAYARKLLLHLFLAPQETTNRRALLFMYNSLIRAHSSAEAIEIYVEMVGQGVSPDKYTFPFALSACAKAGALCEGAQLHGWLVKIGLEEDVFVANSLIHFYAECGEVGYARKVFDEMRESVRNTVSWTSLICGYGRRGMAKEAVGLFFEMVGGGIVSNAVTMVCVVSACAKLKDVALSESVCEYIKESGVKMNTVLVNSLVDMYMKCGDSDAAKRLFDECVDKNLVLYNTVLSNYVREGMADEAISVLGEMLRQGPRPDRVTMLSAIAACGQLTDYLTGKCCHGYVLRNGLEGWDTIYNAIIDMYMKCGQQEMACRVFDIMSNKTVVSWNSLISGFIRSGDVTSAWKIFNEMPNRDLVSWNTMIGALVEESKFKEAIELFRTMQAEGIKADRVAMVEIASACGYLGALDLAKWTHAYIRKNNINCDTRLGTALVDMFAKCGDPQSAMKVFKTMTSRDVSAWTAAIGTMAMEGKGKRALELFDDMLKQGLKPDEVVFAAILTACSHAGLLEQGRNIFMSMQSVHGITPNIVHYGCMVDLLGRAGLLEEAANLIKCMPIEPNDVIWGALLAACRTHKNVEMAAYAAEQISKLTPQRTGSQVLLSNIYASAGKWADVAKVRLQLKEGGIQKVPGCSSIDVNGMIHEFTSGGVYTDVHIEKSNTELMLQEINSRLREAGYVPDLDNVLLDVDEKEKEHMLSRHSEKVAIAFGLIGTGKGIPIRVVKNLRMCSDCHSFAKLVSRIYKREIIVRDNNRFHFFNHGLCSCSDYW